MAIIISVILSGALTAAVHGIYPNLMPIWAWILCFIAGTFFIKLLFTVDKYMKGNITSFGDFFGDILSAGLDGLDSFGGGNGGDGGSGGCGGGGCGGGD